MGSESIAILAIATTAVVMASDSATVAVDTIAPPQALPVVAVDTIAPPQVLPVVAVDTNAAQGDSIPEIVVEEGRMIHDFTLSEADLKAIADSLDVDVPAVRAVIEIEAGAKHTGFWAEGKPLINFDLSVFRRMAAKRKINLTKYQKTHPVVFNRPNVRKYGSQQAACQARLDAARAIDDAAAIESTFWGMFQIGGFNWRKCGAESPSDFVDKMSQSERSQLELFANFLKYTGLDKSLRKHDWRAFARGYNGTSYAKKGYHTKLARAYEKYSKK